MCGQDVDMKFNDAICGWNMTPEFTLAINLASWGEPIMMQVLDRIATLHILHELPSQQPPAPTLRAPKFAEVRNSCYVSTTSYARQLCDHYRTSSHLTGINLRLLA
jgi:hypothetical protein